MAERRYTSWIAWLMLATGTIARPPGPTIERGPIILPQDAIRTEGLLSVYPAYTVTTLGVASNEGQRLEGPFRNSTTPKPAVYSTVLSTYQDQNSSTFTTFSLITDSREHSAIPTTHSRPSNTTATNQTSFSTPVSLTNAPLAPTRSFLLPFIPIPTRVPITYPNFTMPAGDIFAKPIDTRPPPSQIGSRSDHPVPRKGISQNSPIQTNKFYFNFFLGDQTCPAFVFPYSLTWVKGGNDGRTWGMSISHINEDQTVFGGSNTTTGSFSYYFNPVGHISMLMSAKDLDKNSCLTIDSMTAFSARVHLSKQDGSPPSISFPLVQGMSCVTAQYNGAIPTIHSGMFFRNITRAARDPKPNVTKYTFVLEDGNTWRVYAFKTKGDSLDLKAINNGLAEAKSPFFGVIQVCKDPKTAGSEAILDDGAGIYPTTVKLTGTTSGADGKYSFDFEKAGPQSGNLYMYALPHHISSLDDETKKRVQPLRLQALTKGKATMIKGARWTMVEHGMPVNMGFAPWDSKAGSMNKLSDHAKSTIRAAAKKELSQNMVAQSDLDSMYFSGKALAKFATILYVVKDMVGDHALAQTGLGQLKAAFATFAANKQKFPLVHETAWGGIVSSASYKTGDAGVDFGNTYYNDHHFHYGYHILAAAIIGHLDPSWVHANKDYVNSLVRDIANPSDKDPIFPQWRNFDWYHGHSWAHGLYASMDGKNQESSSEDMMHTYAIKMWGKVSGDSQMEARGTLQLSILARSLQHYYLYRNNNEVQPKKFIHNKVAGILFENKVDHTTFFDGHIEAIQGIHMIPILPPTNFVRVKEFVQEEWDTYFSNGRVDKIDNFWKGIIYANYATVNPKKAWEFFSSQTFNPMWIDGGASLTWFLAYAAALGRI